VGESPWGFKSLRPHLGRNFVVAAGFSDQMRWGILMLVVVSVLLFGCGGAAGTRSAESTISREPAAAGAVHATKQSLRVRAERLYERDCLVPEYGGPCAEGPMAFERQLRGQRR
jgi:hypothetical protein